MNAAYATRNLTTYSRAPQAMARTAAELYRACSNAATQHAATAIALSNPEINVARCAERREPYGQGCGHNYLKLCARTATKRQCAASNGDTTTPGFSAARPSTDDLRRPASSSTNAAYRHCAASQLPASPRSWWGPPSGCASLEYPPAPPLRSPFLPLGESARWSVLDVGPCVCGL